MTEITSPARICRAQRLVSPMTERVVVVLSSQVAAELERWLLAQGTRLEWEDMQVCEAPREFADFERLEAVLQRLARIVGERYEPACYLTPLLERVLRQLQQLVEQESSGL